MQYNYSISKKIFVFVGLVDSTRESKSLQELQELSNALQKGLIFVKKEAKPSIVVRQHGVAYTFDITKYPLYQFFKNWYYHYFSSSNKNEEHCIVKEFGQYLPHFEFSIDNYYIEIPYYDDYAAEFTTGESTLLVKIASQHHCLHALISILHNIRISKSDALRIARKTCAKEEIEWNVVLFVRYWNNPLTIEKTDNFVFSIS